MPLWLTLNIIYTFFCVSVVDFEQVNVYWGKKVNYLSHPQSTKCFRKFIYKRESDGRIYFMKIVRINCLSFISVLKKSLLSYLQKIVFVVILIIKPALTYSKSTIETPEHCVKSA